MTKDNIEKLIVNSFLANAIIITQSCDIQRREFISVCPVYEVSNIIEKLSKDGSSQNKIDSFLGTLRKQEINYYFYLPAYKTDSVNIEESYVDLQLVNNLPSGNISLYRRYISLTDQGRHWLGYKLSTLFSRPFIR